MGVFGILPTGVAHLTRTWELGDALCDITGKPAACTVFKTSVSYSSELLEDFLCCFVTILNWWNLTLSRRDAEHHPLCIVTQRGGHYPQQIHCSHVPYQIQDPCQSHGKIFHGFQKLKLVGEISIPYCLTTIMYHPYSYSLNWMRMTNDGQYSIKHGC